MQGEFDTQRRTPFGAAAHAGRSARQVVATAAGAGQVAALACSAYVGAATVVAWTAVLRGKTRTQLDGAPSTRFVVLVPAHDEQRLIRATVERLLRADYPADLFSVHVVADNCTDDTAAIAAAVGAVVHSHTRPGGKGAALSWALARIRDTTPFDAVFIVDADTLVDPGALEVLDARLRAGERVIQSHYAVSDPATSPATALRAAALAVRHYLRPLAKTSVGGSTGLFGNGMAFAADVLAGRAWSSHLTEDIELQLDLLMDGQRIDFAPDAVVRAEMPDTLEAATSQNERWERGRLDLLRRYARPLLARRGPGRVNRLDAVADLALPPFSVLAALTAASTAVGLVAGRNRRRTSRLGASATIAQVVYLASGLVMTRAPRAVWLALLRAPRMVLWKLRLWGRMAARPDAVTWVRTERNVRAS